MKKLFLVSLMLLAGSAWAEWVIFGATDTATHYFDPATIRKDGNMRRVWQLQELNKRHKDGEMSRRIRQEYDCKQERYKILGQTEHSEPMAGGEVLTNFGEMKTWVEIAPDTMSEKILKIVCAK